MWDFTAVANWLSILYSFVALRLSFSIQNDNEEASTSHSFKAYDETKAAPFGDTMDSHTYNEGEGPTCDESAPSPTVDSARGTDLFSPVVLEEEEKETVLPQVYVVITVHVFISYC